MSAQTTPNGRTTDDAIAETERLLKETFENLDPDNDRDGWFMVRLTKIMEALDDRPKPRDYRIGLSVKPKHRTHALYYERGKIIAVHASGTGGLSDPGGILRIELESRRTLLAK